MFLLRDGMSWGVVEHCEDDRGQVHKGYRSCMSSSYPDQCHQSERKGQYAGEELSPQTSSPTEEKLLGEAGQLAASFPPTRCQKMLMKHYSQSILNIFGEYVMQRRHGYGNSNPQASALPGSFTDHNFLFWRWQWKLSSGPDWAQPCSSAGDL